MDATELKRVFQMFDKNGDGTITRKELSETLRSLGIYIPDKELTQMIEKIDVNGDGCVDIDEFGALYKTLMDEEDEEEEDMKEAFNVFDQNGDGFITVDELKTVLSSLGLKQESRLPRRVFNSSFHISLPAWTRTREIHRFQALWIFESAKEMGREKSPGLKILWVWTLGTAAILVTSVVRTRMQDMESMMNQDQAPKQSQNTSAGVSVLTDETALPESDREIAEKL
ncbi:unnamed protein product [Microthlaspi erraticum]|uniref:EF-hand domain-containing protein n=1 Tax=Microthlaspi erraticum TaxID=1685480 RepID=A0A6D2IEE8_9BRAS|nr:unnamed protein product [Microthlaspi erraticum]